MSCIYSSVFFLYKANGITLPLFAYIFKFFRLISIYKDAEPLYNILTVIKERINRVRKMERTFPATLSALRREKNISQRQAAADLQISQALLSHYENGAREPGLGFVCKACDYYGVSADYLLCRTEIPDPSSAAAKAAGDFLDEMQQLLNRAHTTIEEFSAGEEHR